MKKFNTLLIFFMLLVLTGCGSLPEQSVATYGTKRAEMLSEEDTDQETQDEPEAELQGGSETELQVNATEIKIEADSEQEDFIYVYVCGEVESEGVYQLSPGARVIDALQMAGGYSSNAARGIINLARVLQDGERIYFPDQEEAEAGLKMSAETGEIDDGLMIEEETEGLVNINTADKSELMTLPGIGETRAAEIIEYREKHGTFKSKEDLMNVKGIKSGLYDKIKEKIIV